MYDNENDQIIPRILSLLCGSRHGLSLHDELIPILEQVYGLQIAEKASDVILFSIYKIYFYIILCIYNAEFTII